MNELQKLLDDCTFNGNTISPPTEKVDAKLYADFKKLMVSNHGKWKGGKAQLFEFPFPAGDLLKSFQAGERPNFKKDFDYFPTPPEVVEKMLDILMPLDSEAHVLEPSAGQGAIADAIRDFSNQPPVVDCVEIHPINRAKLAEKGHKVIAGDFSTLRTRKRYDYIYANPPFKEWKAHLKKMVQLLDKDGDIVIVLPSSAPTAKEKGSKTIFLDDLAEQFMESNTYEVESGAFKSSGTGVSTIILHLSCKLK